MAKRKNERNDGVIKARVLDYPHGVRTLEHVQMVRIKSKDYSLLIMDDYMPIIGQIEGSVEIVQKDGILPIENIKGFYMHRENEFSLLIESQQESAAAKEETAND